MVVRDNGDIIKFMKELAIKVGPTDLHYEDYAFFGRAAFTTLSEYRGELKLFLEKILEEDIEEKAELKNAYHWLCGER